MKGKEIRFSKWLEHSVLLSEEEMQEVWQLLSDMIWVSPVKKVANPNQIIGREEFFINYRKYLAWILLQEGFPPSDLCKEFTLLIGASDRAFYGFQLPSSEYFIKPGRPVIHVRLERAFFSRFNKTIYSGVADARDFSWGLRFSYPQIYEDPVTGSFQKTFPESDFPETAAYKKLAKHLRNHTVPVTFFSNEEKIIAPFRIGKRSIDLIDRYIRLQNALTEFRNG